MIEKLFLGGLLMELGWDRISRDFLYLLCFNKVFICLQGLELVLFEVSRISNIEVYIKRRF